MPEPFHVDVAQLNTYLAQTNRRDDIPSPRQLLQTAYNAFLAAGILKVHQPAGHAGRPDARSTTPG